MTKIMISVGEASGDLHGASVVTAIKKMCPDAIIFGMGGDNMRLAGAEIVYDINDLGVIGIVEVLKNLPRLFALRDSLAEEMDRRRPDVLVVIDYPGFNVRLAKIAKQKGIPVVSYISPSAWAWGKWRAKEVAETVERVAAIFPFEADVYIEAGAKVTFVGHPLLDIVAPTMTKQEAFELFDIDSQKPFVLLMPGSRQQEIVSLLDDMLSAAQLIRQQVPECQFALPVASTISQEILQGFLQKYAVPVKLVVGNTYDLMNIASAAIAASGTVTLEAALLGLPTVIVYRVNSLTFFLGKRLLKIPYVGLPNIVAGRKILPELLQDEVNAQEMAAQTVKLITDSIVKKQVELDLREVKEKLGEIGAVNRVAQVILDVASQKGEKS